MSRFLFCICFWVGVSACQQHNGPTTSVDSSTQEIRALGQQLAQSQCASCHAFPSPSLLDKDTWKNYVLPRMGYMMGRFPDSLTRLEQIETGPGGAYVKQANIFPESPRISDEDWAAIEAFYLSQAPDTLVKAETGEISSSLPAYFRVLPSNYRITPPSSTLVQIRAGNGLYLGDVHTQSLYAFDAQLQLQQVAKVRKGLVHLRETPEALQLTVMESFSPTDAPSGVQIRLPKSPKEQVAFEIPGLQRPVHSSYADLNGDGLEDRVICEFGKWTGGLAWWEKLPDGRFVKHILRQKPGAIKSIIRDWNEDGLPDVLALFGQGDEGLFLFENQGNNAFIEKRLLTFPSSFGSSDWGLWDLNGDGTEEIVYTAGDNADYPPVMKPYHGIYAFQQVNEDSLAQLFFYPLNGAYKAMPADFDADGDMDFAAISFFPDYAHRPEEGFVYLENAGGFQFEAYSFPEVTAGRWITMDVGDIEGDGDPDIVLGSLAFEVIPKGDWEQRWVEQGLPFVVLENLLR